MTPGETRAWRKASVVIGWLIALWCHAGALGQSCERITLNGQVNAGQQWQAALGRGWVFRLLPIPPSAGDYSGWDLVVDRKHGAGYPDALLLATLPYNSINEREIGTTFGLRAQDAIGWNPRSFHFLSNPQKFRESQQDFREWMRVQLAQGPSPDASPSRRLITRLLALQKDASSGEFRIVDARIVPGIADPKPYAQAWALAGSRMQHEVEPVSPGKESAQGKLVWMRFLVTLWLPAGWRMPAGLSAARAPCSK